jgi:hypothetical protein
MCLPTFTLGRKQIQFLKGCAFQFLEFRTMHKVQNPSNSEYAEVSQFVGWGYILKYDVRSRSTWHTHILSSLPLWHAQGLPFPVNAHVTGA